jgi:hypothetical protein
VRFEDYSEVLKAIFQRVTLRRKIRRRKIAVTIRAVAARAPLKQLSDARGGLSMIQCDIVSQRVTVEFHTSYPSHLQVRCYFGSVDRGGGVHE